MIKVTNDSYLILGTQFSVQSSGEIYESFNVRRLWLQFCHNICPGGGEGLRGLPDDAVGEVSEAGQEAAQTDLQTSTLLLHTRGPEQSLDVQSAQDSGDLP